MDRIYIPVTVDIADKHLPPIIYAKQSDSARGVVISLTNQGATYNIPTGCTVMVRVKKADNNPVVLSAAVESNAIKANFTPQTLAAVGKAVADAALYASDGKLLSSFIFIISVEAAAVDSTEITSSAEYEALGRLLADYLRYLQEFTTAEAARNAAEATRQSQETARVSAEAARQSAESARAAAETTRGQNEATRQSQEAARQSAENSRSQAEAARVTEYTALTADLRQALANIKAAVEAAARIEQIYNSLQISLGYDEDGDVCAVYIE